MRSPSVASRSRTRGWRIAIGPMPVMISRSGRWPWRTTRCRPVSVFRSACFATNSATSASTAWVSSKRAPLRRISVRESMKASGWASLMTLLSDTAYHSFIGEVEALNTTTIRRLIRSCRHQLLAIARHSVTLIGTAYNLAPIGAWFPPFIEAAIAASIFYMAIENIIGADLNQRWIITGLFGLVHGFGFADALKDQLQFAGSYLLVSLLSFNLGIEIGQLA